MNELVKSYLQASQRHHQLIIQIPIEGCYILQHLFVASGYATPNYRMLYSEVQGAILRNASL